MHGPCIKVIISCKNLKFLDMDYYSMLPCQCSIMIPDHNRVIISIVQCIWQLSRKTFLDHTIVWSTLQYKHGHGINVIYASTWSPFHWLPASRPSFSLFFSIACIFTFTYNWYKYNIPSRLLVSEQYLPHPLYALGESSDHCRRWENTKKGQV